jgi:hypothetical protein
MVANSPQRIVGLDRGGVRGGHDHLGCGQPRGDVTPRYVAAGRVVDPLGPRVIQVQ